VQLYRPPAERRVKFVIDPRTGGYVGQRFDPEGDVDPDVAPEQVVDPSTLAQTSSFSAAMPRPEKKFVTFEIDDEVKSRVVDPSGDSLEEIQAALMTAEEKGRALAEVERVAAGMPRSF